MKKWIITLSTLILLGLLLGSSAKAQRVNYTLSFRLDMSLERLNGTWDFNHPVFMITNLNNWVIDPRFEMKASMDNPEVVELTFTMPGLPGQEFEFKFHHLNTHGKPITEGDYLSSHHRKNRIYTLPAPCSGTFIQREYVFNNLVTLPLGHPLN